MFVLEVGRETLYQSALPRLKALNSKRTMERYEAAVKGNIFSQTTI